MNKPLQTLTAASSLCAALLFPHPGLAAPATAEHEARTVRLEVDVEDLGDRGIGLDQAIRDQLGQQIERAEFELVDEGEAAGEAEAAVTLSVRFRALQSGDYDYGVHFEFIDEDGRVPAIEWVDCHMCVDARLMPVLDEQTPALLAALDARLADPVQVPAPVPVLVPVRADRADQTVPARDLGEEPEHRAITGLGITGSVIAWVGIGALIGGGVELSRGVIVETNTGNERGERIDHRPAGYMLIGVGSTALVAGVVMLAVDLARQTKKRKQLRAGQAGVYPMFTPDGAGLGVLGKF